MKKVTIVEEEKGWSVVAHNTDGHFYFDKFYELLEFLTDYFLHDKKDD